MFPESRGEKAVREACEHAKIEPYRVLALLLARQKLTDSLASRHPQSSAAGEIAGMSQGFREAFGHVEGLEYFNELPRSVLQHLARQAAADLLVDRTNTQSAGRAVVLATTVEKRDDAALQLMWQTHQKEVSEVLYRLLNDACNDGESGGLAMDIRMRPQ